MTTHTELYSMQILQEANTIVKYLTRVVDDTEVFYGGIITRFEVLDSTVGLDEIHATLNLKVVQSQCQWSFHGFLRKP